MGNTNSGSNKSAKRIRVGHHPHGNLRSNIVPEINTIIWHDYRRLAEIGGGKMGSICTAIKLERDQSSESSSETKKQYAIKEAIVAAKSKHFVECLRIEIDALKALDHPNIIKPHAVYFTRKSLYLVIQNCTGGNLYSGFKADPSTGQKVPLSEKKTAEIVHQLLSAVAHMHSHGVCHRDIKFENVLFETEHPDSKIKVIDFGIAQNVKVMYECCGTTYTMAREVLTLKGYTNKVDIWSVGVIVYMMLSLTKPFYGKNKLIITNKIMKVSFG
jgi:serine/threonine protein kinase